jgi:O-antigen/teichoic acid export membrane protein
MSGGRIIAQVVPILITPVITRIYSPREFGLFAVFSTIVSFMAMISNGRYCLAILLPEKRDESKSLVVISMFFTTIFSFIFLFLISVFSEQFFGLFNIDSLSQYRFIFFFTILVIGLHEALYYYALREKKYKLLARNAIIQAVSLVLFRLVLGILGYTNFGLLFSYMLGYFISTFLLLIDLKLFHTVKISLEDSFVLIKKYIDFLKYSLFSNTMSFLATTSPNLFLNRIFSSTVTGHYSLSEKVLGSPIWFITSSVSDVFKQEFSEHYRKGQDFVLLFKKTAKGLLIGGLVPFFIIFLLSPFIISPLLGKEWAPVGDYIRVFTLMYYSTFVVNPLKSVTYILNKQRLMIVFESLRFIAILVAFYIGYRTDNIKITLLTWSSLVTIVNVVVFLVIYRLVLRSKSEKKNS